MRPTLSSPRRTCRAGALVLLAVVLAGCLGGRLVERQGVVSTRQADRGIYALTDADGEVYHPLNLPDRYRRDSLAVYFVAERRRRARVAGMTGTPVELRRILPMRVQGALTVRRVDTLGVDYGLVDADGYRFHPLTPLGEDFQLDSLAVTADLQLRPDTLADSTRWGMPAAVRTLAYADTTLHAHVARVVHQELEGGFYGLVDLDGTRWRPTRPLPERFRKEGARVRVLLRPAEAQLSLQMWGRPAEVVHLRALD